METSKLRDMHTYDGGALALPINWLSIPELRSIRALDDSTKGGRRKKKARSQGLELHRADAGKSRKRVAEFYRTTEQSKASAGRSRSVVNGPPLYT